MKAVNEAMLLHPCFNIRHFEKRVKAMLDWGDAGLSNPYSLSTSASGSGAGLANGRTGVEEYARDVLFGTPFSHTTNGKPKANGKDSGRAQAQQQSGSPKPTLSFFAATCSALALGALVERGCESQAADVFVDPLSNSSNPLSVIDTAGRGTDGQRTSPAALFALSEQALSLFEKTSSYDLDAMTAMLLQVLFQLHDGQMNVAQGVLPLVGKMIQVARIMGLAIDPDEFPGTYSLFEAELRRRIWWSVFYYDLFISDCLGHPPLIPDNSFTTRLPADVDEDQFTPSSTTLPILSNAEGTEKGTAYLILKLR
ncbi:fungal-specific transcription factor domain-containing protein [Sparassis latifolia]